MEYNIQVKICGITREADASACVSLGADAVGLVFYPPSSRHVSMEQARRIIEIIPDHILTVGVFVDESPETIKTIVEYCGLRAVQLHGVESPSTAEVMKKMNVKVIKAIFVNGSPGPAEMGNYGVDAFLLEAPRGPIPGGTGTRWEWGRVKDLSKSYPVILAGGLNPENVTEAINASLPDAVDVSSGVERAPGIKDIDKVRRFIESVKSCSFHTTRRIFYG
ncbi:MAG: phosphoribosylanthranilate isomerase [Vulcanimicrobiota bacterium]